MNKEQFKKILNRHEQDIKYMESLPQEDLVPGQIKRLRENHESIKKIYEQRKWE